MGEKPVLCVTDDDPGFRELVRSVGEALGFEVLEARSGAALVEQSKGRALDVVVLDIVMPEKHGVEVLDFLQEEHPGTATVIVTGKGAVFLDGALRLARRKQVRIAGALEKPVPMDELERVLKPFSRL